MGPFSIMNLVTNTLSIMAITVFWSWVFNSAGGSILIAILLHAASNATGQLVPSLLPNLPANIESIMFGAYAVVVVLIVAATRGRLGYRSETMPPIAPGAGA